MHREAQTVVEVLEVAGELKEKMSSKFDVTAGAAGAVGATGATGAAGLACDRFAGTGDAVLKGEKVGAGLSKVEGGNWVGCCNHDNVNSSAVQ